MGTLDDMDQHTTSRVAVVYATAHGSTREIAEYIGANLAGRGAVVEVADVEHAPDLSRFDAVVLGSAVHEMAFLPEAVEYVHTHREALTALDVWLFGVGLVPALRGPIGRRIARMVPKRIAQLRDSLDVRDYRCFAGLYDRFGISMNARILHRLMGGGRYGDLRDWTAIELWSDSIAEALELPGPQPIPIHP